MNGSDVTAIVSAWYCEKFLEGRIDNLLALEHVPEIVVVCPLNSKEYDIASKASGMNVTVYPTTGDITLYKAWNIGIKMSHRPLCTNANADDRLHKHGLDALVNNLIDNDLDVSYGEHVIEDEDGHMKGMLSLGTGGYDELKKGCFVGPMPVWKKSLGHFNPDYKYAGDYEFWLRCAKAGAKFGKLNAVVGTYTTRPDSLEHKYVAGMIWEAAKARRDNG